jgi:hypothetical protein
MEPTLFQFSSPDSDGEFLFGVKVEIKNTGVETAELLQRHLIFFATNLAFQSRSLSMTKIA